MIERIRAKILDLPAARRRAAAWRLLGGRIVFTNGCFDLIHPGHLEYLAEARGLGHHLIVGLNSDASVRRLKGDNRPIMDQEARALLLASLSYVDAVVLFEEDTPLQLIAALHPDVLVKGGDYDIDGIVGAREVQSWGGEVTVLPFKEGYSTSSIVERIVRSH